MREMYLKYRDTPTDILNELVRLQSRDALVMYRAVFR